jgi:hypothetical protein
MRYKHKKEFTVRHIGDMESTIERKIQKFLPDDMDRINEILGTDLEDFVELWILPGAYGPLEAFFRVTHEIAEGLRDEAWCECASSDWDTSFNESFESLDHGWPGIE